jgi:hypothetical protein
MPERHIGPSWMMSTLPPLFLTGATRSDLLGIATMFGDRFGNVDAGFIVFPTCNFELENLATEARKRYLEHVTEFPRHAIGFICNTAAETRLFQRQGLPATLLNQNFTVSETSFHPVPSAAIEFDAIHNARFVRGKRHNLCSLVPTVAHITFVEDGLAHRVTQFADLYRTVIVEKPGHVLINRIAEGLPVRMSPEEINTQLARAAVGLLLSHEEGGHYASMEYLLAGLPVVATPSTGGRELYFDDDYCIICDPTPEAVRDAVATLKAKNIPREEVRARTIAKIEPARARLLAMADEILIELGSEPAFAGVDWPYRHLSSVKWHPMARYLEDFEAAAGVVLPS